MKGAEKGVRIGKSAVFLSIAITLLSTIVVAGTTDHFACAKAMKSFVHEAPFTDHSINVLDPQITFSADEIEHLKEQIKAGPLGPFGSMVFLFKLVGNDYVQVSSLLFESETKVVPSPLHPAVNAKILEMIKLVDSFVKNGKGHRAKIIRLDLRISSNSGLFSIRKGNGFQPVNDEGLHQHSSPGSVDFVWALSGPGARVKFGTDDIRLIPEGLMAFFGPAIFHGSPDSPNDRLIIVGSATDKFGI